MGQVQNIDSVKIQKTTISNGKLDSFDNVNSLFNGYVYDLSFTVGSNGEPSVVNLNLALNKTLKKTTTTLDRKDKEDVSYDSDFNINEDDLDIDNSYDIFIGKYALRNFKITNFSITKKDNEKLLTLTLSDISIVLSKIFVGLLGQHIGLDERSEVKADVNGIKIFCPELYDQKAQLVKDKKLEQTLHFANNKVFKNFKQGFEKSGIEIAGGETYTIIQASKDNQQFSIENGYGAIILLGEEEYRDSPCANSEVTYSFETLLLAIQKLGIKIAFNNDNLSLQDKSRGRIKKNFLGTLKDVLNQWCGEYSYSYTVDFSAQGENGEREIKIKGIDLSSETSKVVILNTKKRLESLEKNGPENEKFVIKSSDFSLDSSRKKLKLYSSYYFKEAKEKQSSSEQSLGNKNFYCMDLRLLFPSWFGAKDSTGKYSQLDFCGSGRTYEQVVTSAVLGKYSAKLRQIYNYSIGAFRALGFISASKLRLPDRDLLLQEAISSIVEIQMETLFNSSGDVLYDFHMGFYNQDLVNHVERIEGYIADFIGKHYWTDFFDIKEGSLATSSSYNEYEITTDPSADKLTVSEVYNLDIFKQARSLIHSLSNVFQRPSTLEIYEELMDLKEKAKLECLESSPKVIQDLKNSKLAKHLVFYAERSSATYSAFEELIKEMEVFKYKMEGDSEVYGIDLADMYAPSFKELTPVSMGLVNAALAVDFANAIVGDFKFGILYCLKERFFTFTETFSDGDVLKPHNTDPNVLGNTGGKNASAQAVVVAGKIKKIEITNGGFGYLGIPSVTIVPENQQGSGATAEGVITRGVVTDIQVTNEGNGYSNSPTVNINEVQEVAEGENMTLTQKQNLFYKPELLGGKYVNVIEYQQQIISYCQVLQKTNETQILKDLKNTRDSCSKTILYEVCIKEAEQAKIELSGRSEKQAAIGPNPLQCRAITVFRKQPSATMIGLHAWKMQERKGSLSVELFNPAQIVNVGFLNFTKSISTLITLPSEKTYPIALMSKSTSEVITPFKQLVRGGLENADDVIQIINNSGFSVDIFLNNITPNIKEPFDDSSAPEFVEESDFSPTLANYIKTKAGDSPQYEFTTFHKFHDGLKEYYDSKAVSISSSTASYSVDLFCNSISEDLKSLLSVENGLTNLNITFGQGGLNVKCKFDSQPAQEQKMETLIYKNKPNIKFQNNNFST